MKKLLLVIPIALYLFVTAYSMSDGKTDNVLSDLEGLKQLETQASFDKLSNSGTELYIMLKDQEKLIKTMDEHIYYGSLNYNDIDCKEVLRLVNNDTNYLEKAAIFQGKAYKEYFELRSHKVLSYYDKTGLLNINDVISDSRSTFDSFMTELEKSASKSKELTLLLQNKLMEKLVYDDFPDKGKYFYEVLSLRKQDKENYAKRRVYIYQLFESRARLEILEYAINKNKQNIYDKTKAISIKVYSQKEHKLESSTEAVKFYKSQEGYWALLPLWELVDFDTYKSLRITTTEGSMVSIPGKKAAESVFIDKKLQLGLDLNKLIAGKADTAEHDSPSQSQETESAIIGKQEELWAVQYAARAPAGRIVAREINKYGMYIDSRKNRKDSLYVKEFEKNKKSWQAELKRGLNLMDPTGKNSSDKLFNLILFNRKLGEMYDSGKLKNSDSIREIIKYREQALQFRSFTEGELWLLDMYYELWSNGEMQ